MDNSARRTVSFADRRRRSRAAGRCLEERNMAGEDRVRKGGPQGARSFPPKIGMRRLAAARWRWRWRRSGFAPSSRSPLLVGFAHTIYCCFSRVVNERALPCPFVSRYDSIGVVMVNLDGWLGQYLGFPCSAMIQVWLQSWRDLRTFPCFGLPFEGQHGAVHQNNLHALILTLIKNCTVL